MMKILFFIFLVICSFFGIKVNANNVYETTGSYRFYITSEQKIVIYENYGVNNFYSGVYECGYGLDENNTYYREVFQIRAFINGENKVIFVDQTGFINWNGPSVSNNYKLIKVYFINQDDLAQFGVVQVYKDPDDGQFYVDYTWFYNGNQWQGILINYSLAFESYLISLYYDSTYDTVYPQSVYELYYNYSTLPSSVLIETVNCDYSFYFSNLKTNYPDNIDGSCGYVAMSMITAYYDSFYNGDFVYNNDYLNLITKSSTLYLDCSTCMDSPGATNNLKNMLIDVADYIGIRTSPDDSLGLTPSETVSILDYYINWFSDYSYNHSTSELSTIYSILTELYYGRPVILCLSDFVYFQGVTINNTFYYLPKYHKSINHMVIAYGYTINNEGDIFFRCHTGWKDNDVNIILNDVIIKPMNYSNMKGIKLELTNNIHVHSNNYLYYLSPVCPCEATLPNSLNFELLKRIGQSFLNEFSIDNIEYCEMEDDEHNETL